MAITTNWLLDLLLATTLLFYLLYKYMTRNHDYWKIRGVPHKTPSPIIGNIWPVLSNQLSIGNFLRELHNSTNQPFLGFHTDRPALLIRDPELSKTILVKDFQIFDNHSVLSGEKLDPILPHMLFFSRNPEWKQSRSKLTPVFSTGKLRAMCGLINEVGDNLLEHLSGFAEKGVIVDAKEVCNKFATDVIASCFFGIDAKSFEDENAEFAASVKKLFGTSWTTWVQQTSYFFAHTLAKCFGMRMFHPGTMEFLTKAFSRTVGHREKSGFSRNDLIDFVIKMKENKEYVNEFNLNGDTIAANAVQLFMAGLETTSLTISFALHELSMNKTIQDKLRQEITQTLNTHNKIDYDTLKDMKYLDQCVRETLRKYPAMPFVDRDCNSTYTLPGTNVTIDKGTAIYVSLLGLHHDPQYFPEPEKFDPERFSGENKISDAYIPFGNGPRICIGERLGVLNTKMAVARIISKYEVIKTEKSRDPVIFDPRCPILKAADGIPVRFKKLE
nr:cytochrome P450 monooxygenase CYP345BA1 [Lasioderma serricorne]